MTRLLRFVIAIMSGFAAWWIARAIFPDHWDFISVGMAMVIFLVLSGTVQWMEFRNAPPPPWLRPSEAIRNKWPLSFSFAFSL